MTLELKSKNIESVCKEIRERIRIKRGLSRLQTEQRFFLSEVEDEIDEICGNFGVKKSAILRILSISKYENPTKASLIGSNNN